MVHIEDTEKAAHTISKGMPKSHLEAIVSFLDKNYKLNVSEDSSDFTRSPQHVKSILKQAGFSPEDQSKENLIAWKYYEALVKVKEKEGLIEMIKSEQMKAIVKVLSPILQDLMVEIYIVSDLPKLFVDSLVLVKKVITVSETNFKTEQLRQNAYRDLSVEITAVCLFFLFPSFSGCWLLCVCVFFTDCFLLVFFCSQHSFCTSSFTMWHKKTTAPFTSLHTGSWICGTTARS